MSRPSLYLLDGYALVYRAYFALVRSPLRTSTGELTSAVFGMANFLVKLLDERRPDYLGVVFDSREPTFRHEQFPEYKATREKMPEDLADQLARVGELFAAFRVPVIEMAGQEADDVIGTLARKGAESGLDVYIVSGDKDFYQLIDDNIRLLNPGRGGPGGVDEEVIDQSNAHQKFGVKPEQVPDVLGLMGDSSDNIPGVPGVGLKTAQKLITEWGSVEGIYENIGVAGTPKLRDRLSENRDAALMSKNLVTIRTQLDVDLDLQALVREEPDAEAVTALFAELEFHPLLQRFGAAAEVMTDADYRIVKNLSELNALVDAIRRAGRFAVDIDATSPDPLQAEIRGVALAAEAGRAWYVPVGDPRSGAFELETALERLGPLLRDPAVDKVGHDVKPTQRVLQRHGVTLAGIAADTTLAAYLLDPARRAYDLDVLAIEFLGHKIAGEGEPDGSTSQTELLPTNEVDLEAVARHGCERADVALRLADSFLSELEGMGLIDLYRKVELPLIPVLAAIENQGIALDLKFFEVMSSRLTRELHEIERDCYALAGGEFNLNSPQQLSRVLFEELELPVVKRTKTGYSTGADVLETLALEHELPRRIIDYRELAKLKSTYVDALPAAISEVTGRLHSSFNQTIASSGRLSSSDPNLQNIPVRTALGREIRRGFVPSRDGWTLLVSDYSQIELRILAHLSGDANLVDAFRCGHDIHRQTAALVFGLDPQEVTSDLRTRAKEVNFGVVYGMGVFGLASRLGISRDEAKDFIDGYFERFPDVKRFQEETIESARELGYVTTLLGRRRYLPEIQSRNFNTRSFAERAAINSPIQGTAADLIKIAMIRIHDRLTETKLPAHMLLTVHDELVFEVDESATEALAEAVRVEMEGAIDLSVPVVVEIGVGPTWYDAK